jgi:hypothetical protein
LLPAAPGSQQQEADSVIEHANAFRATEANVQRLAGGVVPQEEDLLQRRLPASTSPPIGFGKDADTDNAQALADLVPRQVTTSGSLQHCVRQTPLVRNGRCRLVVVVVVVVLIVFLVVVLVFAVLVVVCVVIFVVVVVRRWCF